MLQYVVLALIAVGVIQHFQANSPRKRAHRQRLYSLANFVQTSDPSAKLGFERLKLVLRAHSGKVLIGVGIGVFITHFVVG